MKSKGYLLAAISAISYGLLPIFIIPIKESNYSLDVTLIYRFLFGGLILLAYLLLKHGNLKINLKEFLILISLGICYSLSSEFLFLGYDYISPGIASTILFTYPVLVAAISLFFFREKITKSTALALLIVLLGVLTLSYKENLADINFFGLFICLLGALTYAIYMIIVNKSRIKISGIKLSMYSMLFSSAYFTIKSVITNQNILITDPYFLLDISIFSLITTVFSVTALIYAIKYIGSTSTGIMGALEPVVAIGISVLLFNESITWSLILGGILIIIGVVLNIIFDSKNV